MVSQDHQKRGPWSQQEDLWLLRLVHTTGAHNWVRIASVIQTRSPKQCRERFHQNLKPSLNHEPITPDEGIIIERLVGEMGKRWAEIARRLRGRSDNAVKNWWNGGMNRRRRLVGRREGSDHAGEEKFNESKEPLSFARPPPPTPGRPVQNLYIPPTGTSIEAPMISPTTSDTCMSESISEAPSLVSDHSSQVSAASPQSGSPPSIMLPRPIDTRVDHQQLRLPRLQTESRSSGLGLPSPSRSLALQQRPLPSLGRGSLDQLADLAIKTQPVSPSDSYRQLYPTSTQNLIKLPPMLSPDCSAPPRDKRMSFGNLLN